MSIDPGERRGLTPGRLITAALVLIVVVVVATVLIMRAVTAETTTEARRETTPPPPATSPTSPTAPTSREPTDPAPTAGEAYESACGLRGGSLQEPTREPSDLTWERIDGWAYPISPSAGPGRRDPTGPWSCFARTPTGAVIAAHTIGLRLGLAADFESVVRAQTVPGVGQSALLQEGPTEAEGITDTKGFVIESYSNDDAVISFYLVNQGRSFTCSTTVQWRDDDWKMRPEPDGSTSSGCIEQPPTRFVPWGDR